MMTLALPLLLGALHLVPAPQGAPWTRQAPAEALREPLADSEPARFNMSLKVPDKAALDRFLADLQNPESPSYHQWIGAEEFGRRFGVSEARYERVASWLAAQGFTVERSPNRIFIAATGQARHVRKALGIQLRWVNDRGGRRARSFSGTPKLPDDFAGSVLAMDGLDTRLRFVHHYDGQVFAAGDFRTFYDVAGGLGGATGQSTAILGTQVQNNAGPAASDISWYFQNVSNATATYNPITLPNTNSSFDSADANAEYTLDVEMQSVGAPNATSINLILAPEDTVYSDGLNYVVTNLATVAVVSTSLGLCESSAGAQYAEATEQLIDEGIAAGIAYFAATGDSGADDCSQAGACSGSGGAASIDFPSDIPEVIAMGGTQLTSSANWNGAGNINAYQEESVWNDSSQTTAGGGGQSTIFTTKPPWQVGVGPNASDGVRDTPDMALMASGTDPGVMEYYQGNTGIVSGTSIASPLAAGMFANLAGFCKTRLGDMHTTLYGFGTSNAGVFNDVTQGNNSLCGVTGFTAQAGYDLASGWGSFDLGKLASAWPNCGTGIIPDAGVTVTVGATCSTNAQCNTNGGTLGQCYLQEEPYLPDGGNVDTGFLGGYCTAGCIAPSDGGVAVGGCPVNSVCWPEPGGGQSLCLESCSGYFPGACPRTDNSPYFCDPLVQDYSQSPPVLADFVCFPGCQQDADCEDPGVEVCDTATNQCVVTCSGDVDPTTNANLCEVSPATCANPGVACGTPGATMGAACTQDNDCPVGGFCNTAADGFPGGYCSAAPCGQNPTGVCGTGAACVIIEASSNFGECYATCASSSQCRTGYGCGAGNSGGPNVCLPLADIGDGGTASSSSSSSSSSSGAASSSSSSGGNNGSGNGGGSSGNGGGNNSGNNGGGSSGAGSGGGNNGGGNGGGNNGGGVGPGPKPQPASGGSGGGCSTAAPSEMILWAGWLLGLGLKRRRG